MAPAVPVRSHARALGAGCGLGVLLGFLGSALAEPCLDSSDEARAALKARHLIEARAKLRLCAASECAPEVRTLCDERLAEVTERIPTVIFDAKRADGDDLFDVTITIDSAPRPDVAMGAEVALDPGPHEVVLRDARGSTVERRIVVIEREKARREHFSFGAPELRSRAAPEVERVKVEVPVVYAVPRSVVVAQGAGLFALGGATIGALVGTSFGVLAVTRNDAANCDTANVCESPGARSEARVAATVSTVTLLSALGLGAIGVTLLVWPKAPPRPTRLSVTPLGVVGRF